MLSPTYSLGYFISTLAPTSVQAGLLSMMPVLDVLVVSFGQVSGDI